jgi:hypothetical protein
MRECEEFEIAIEKRRQGALSPDQETLLEHHLASCPTCARYAQLAGQTEVIMATATRDALEQVDWNRMGARVRQMAAQYTRAIPGMAIMLAILVPVIGWVSGWENVYLAAGLGAALLVLQIWRNRNRVREATLSQQKHSDLLFFYRTELDRRITSVNRASVIEFLIGALLVVTAGIKVSGLIALSEATRLTVFQAVFGLALLALGVYRRWVQLPRIRSEREEIS